MSRLAMILGSSFLLVFTLLVYQMKFSSRGVMALSAPTITPSRIVVAAYGDSLTAGTSDGGLFPYAKHLQETLEGDGQVYHRGLPGWTTEQMMIEPNDPVTGLASFLSSILSREPTIHLCIILAGTNDIGYRYPVDLIVRNLLNLHGLCHAREIPTLALGIPPSGFLQQVAWAREVQQQANADLQAWAQSTSLVTFQPFSFFDYADGDDRYWSADGLHFSPTGYQVLGEELAPIVRDILQLPRESSG